VAHPVFLITGAATGIGAATARRAAQAGYRVVLAGRGTDELAALAEELGGRERALAVAMEVAEWEDQERLVAQALERFGRLDVAYANAGIGATRGFLSESPEYWRELIDTNVLGVAYTIRATLPALRETTGHLLVTSSTAGRLVFPASLYSATKHAVTAMAEALRLEVGDAIRVTTILPGSVDTPLMDNPVPGALDPDDIARGVLYAVTQPANVAVNEMVIRPARSND